MSRTPFDAFAKDLTQQALSSLGTATTDVRLTSDPQFADLCFERDAERAADPRPLGLLGAMASERALFEFAHQAPDVAELGTWQHKQLTWAQLLANEARRDQRPRAALPPLLWGLCAGRPGKALAAYGFVAMGTPWPRGCYEGPPAGTLRLAVISELPRSRETLLLRLMGAGATLTRALGDFGKLPPDAPERTLAVPLLVQLRLQLDDSAPHDPDAQEILMQTQKLYEEILRNERVLGAEIGRREGAEIGRREALRDFLCATLSDRGFALSDAQRATLAAEQRLDLLQRWCARAVTATNADDVFA